MKLASRSSFWMRTWWTAAKVIKNVAATSTVESVIAAKIEAAVVPRRSALRA